MLKIEKIAIVQSKDGTNTAKKCSCIEHRTDGILGNVLDRGTTIMVWKLNNKVENPQYDKVVEGAILDAEKVTVDCNPYTVGERKVTTYSGAMFRGETAARFMSRNGFFMDTNGQFSRKGTVIATSTPAPKTQPANADATVEDNIPA